MVFHQGDGMNVSCYYIDPDLKAFAISSAQVCSVVLGILNSSALCISYSFFLLLFVKNFRCTRILLQISILSWRGEVYDMNGLKNWLWDNSSDQIS